MGPAASTVSAPPLTSRQRFDRLDPVLAELRERRDAFHDAGYVPRDFIERLKSVGIYRAATPTRFGGEHIPPAEFLRLIERIAEVDGSTGWVASFGSSLIYLAALHVDTQAQLYATGPDVVFAGGLFPVQPGVPTERGYRLNGRWKFASGSRGADILGVGLQGDERSEGKPLTALLSPQQVEIADEWDVVGMRATGSFDLIVRDVEVDREWTFVRGGTPTIDEPLYRYPTIAYAGQVLAVVGAGVARAALDHAAEHGAPRAGITGAPSLRERSYFRTGFAAATSRLRSARAWFYEETESVWQSVLDGDEVRDEQNATLRLASSQLATVAAQVVQEVAHLVGTPAIYAGNPLERLLGDALVPQQHAFLSPAIVESAGAVLLGAPPTVPGFR